jgi:hypothetical protein
MLAHRGVTHGVDPAMEPVQPPIGDPPGDRVLVQTRLGEIGEGHDAVLRGG